VAPKAPPAPEPQVGPTVEFYGEGAEAVEFVKNPNAKSIRVYNSGVILENY
jgi:hypothetical protein